MKQLNVDPRSGVGPLSRDVPPEVGAPSANLTACAEWEDRGWASAPAYHPCRLVTVPDPKHLVGGAQMLLYRGFG